MSDFKIGDKVRLQDPEAHSSWIRGELGGKVGTVIFVYDDESWNYGEVDVEFPRTSREDGEFKLAIDDLELVIEDTFKPGDKVRLRENHKAGGLVVTDVGDTTGVILQRWSSELSSSWADGNERYDVHFDASPRNNGNYGINASDLELVIEDYTPVTYIVTGTFTDEVTFSAPGNKNAATAEKCIRGRYSNLKLADISVHEKPRDTGTPLWHYNTVKRAIEAGDVTPESFAEALQEMARRCQGHGDGAYRLLVTKLVDKFAASL